MSTMAGQTLTEIRDLLAERGLTPRHRFGQNFLIDLNIMRKLPALAGVSPADVVLEVGPGTGSLTEMLLESGARVIAAEIDTGLAALLRERLGAHPRFLLAEGDALAGKHELSPAIVAALRAAPPEAGGARKLVANLPYQIATPLMLELLLLAHSAAPLVIERQVCTIQKEVAQRLTAAARDEPYGPISVVAQTLARVKLEVTIPPAAFWPRPDVDSAIVSLLTRSAEELRPLLQSDSESTGATDAPSCPAGEFAQFVRLHFQQRRKTLRASSRNTPDAERLPAACRLLGLSEQSRPEELTPAQWQALFRQCRPR